MRRGRIIAIVLLVVAIGIVAGIILFIIYGGRTADLRVNHQYFIHGMRSNTFFHNDGMAVSLVTNDASSAVFTPNFSNMEVTFRQGGRVTVYNFVISTHQNRRGGPTATLHGIVAGRLARLYLTTSDNFIYIRTAVNMTVKIGSDGEVEEVITRDTVILRFHRNTPAYITGGGP